MVWNLRHGRVAFGGPAVVMGVVNVTPDSFSDGGESLDRAAALRRAGEMVAQGAAILDVGPESTRPGSEAVSDEEQIRRIDPLIGDLRAAHPDIPISIDTRRATVARRAIELGADIINDISALRDDADMATVATETGAPVILMHMLGTPATMQAGPIHYDDVVGDVVRFLSERIEFACSRGIARERLAVDPGIGFGKTAAHNLHLLAGLDAFTELGVPIVVGASRKSFIGKVLDEPDAKRRMHGSVACAVAAVLAGAHVIRAHDVGETVEAVRMANAIRAARNG